MGHSCSSSICMPASPVGRSAFNLRCAAAQFSLPQGGCIYIQSGDPSDFDGYLIAKAGAEIARYTDKLEFVVVVPERRACKDRAELDTNKHEPEFSEHVMATAGKLVRALCPKATIIRGPLNQKNIIPLKFIFSEPEKYSPLLPPEKPKPWVSAAVDVRWDTLKSLAERINSGSTTSVILDMHGAVGYLSDLIRLCPDLGRKVKRSGMPVVVMAGVLSEVPTTTLPVPGRDPRSTMNAIYYTPVALLELAKKYNLPLLFVTNNTCTRMLKFEDAAEVVQNLGLQGLLRQLAEVWYGPHLKGKCVPFDWVSLVALLLSNRWPELMKTERRQLYVGNDEASVLVLHDPALPATEVSTANLSNTYLWGEVDSVVEVNHEAMLALAQLLAST